MNYFIKYYDNPATEIYFQLVQNLYSSTQLPFLNNAINSNYFYKTIIVFIDENPCGYCVVYKNEFLILENKPCLAIGNWECIEDQLAAKLLLDECTKITNELKIQNIIGPINGSTWDNYRFSINEVNENFFGEAQQKNYYVQQWLKNNFAVLTKYTSSVDSNLELYNTEKLKKYQNKLFANNIKIRNIDLDNFEQEIENIFSFCENSFKNNFLFTPISKSVFVNKYIILKKYLDAQYIFIAEQNNVVIAFLLAYPDHIINSKKRIVLKTIASESARQNAGLAYIMTNLLIENCIKNNIKSIIHAYMHQSNESRLNSEKYNAQIFKQYALFIKTI